MIPILSVEEFRKISRRRFLSHNWEKSEAARAEAEKCEALLNFVGHG